MLGTKYCLIVIWQHPSGKKIEKGLNLLQSLERNTKKWSCCSAHLQDVFQNSNPHDPSTKMHIFLLVLGRNSLFLSWWVSIKNRNNYFLYKNAKGFFLQIIAKSLLEEYWNYTNWNCSEQGLRQWVIHYCWINFLTLSSVKNISENLTKNTSRLI